MAQLINETALRKIARYDELADRYDQSGNQMFYQELTKMAVSPVEQPLSGKAMDLACGTGFSLEILSNLSPQLMWVGLDESREMLRHAKRKSYESEVELIRGQAEDLPFADQTFEWVHSSFALHWFGAKSFDEIYRVLKRGGLMTAVIPLKGVSKDHGGNQLLHRKLFELRGKKRRSITQGFALKQVEKCFSKFCIERIEKVTFVETFVGESRFWDVMESRGSLAAIFGDKYPKERIFSDLNHQELMDFSWSVAFVEARKDH